jgi:hypothetical protein
MQTTTPRFLAEMRSQNFMPGLTSNCNPPCLHLLSRLDYKFQPPYTSNIKTIVTKRTYLGDIWISLKCHLPPFNLLMQSLFTPLGLNLKTAACCAEETPRLHHFSGSDCAHCHFPPLTGAATLPPPCRTPDRAVPRTAALHLLMVQGLQPLPCGLTSCFLPSCCLPLPTATEQVP